jgi:dolichol-phosphate mannosyltransferase
MIVWILLPAYNEVDSLPMVLPKLKRVFEEKGQSYRIVVVEDGSTDDSYNKLLEMKDEYPLDIVRHKLNRGLGETERDGFEFFAEHAGEDDVLVRLDCDDTHEPEYILGLIDRLQEGYDVIIASRFQRGGGQRGVNLYRAFVSYSANLFMKLIFNVQGVRDYSCGFRAYRGKVIKDAVRIFGNLFIQLKGLGFTSTLETVVKLKLLGCRFSEIPFVLRYDKKASASKMVSSVTALGYLTMALLYHWPFGGWRRSYRDLARVYRESPEAAFRRFGCGNVARSTVCQIGG